MRGEIINLIVASSNLFGLWPLYKSYYGNHQKLFDHEPLLILIMIIASFLMHISERKHNLPGLLFGDHCNWFLWFDRIMAWTLSLYVGLYLCIIGYVFVHRIAFGLVFLKMFIGLQCLYASEHIEPPYYPQEWFALWHIVWHYFAYDILFIVV